MLASEFMFVLSQAGAEKALKRELARRRPELRPGYERKGLVTFRSSAPCTPEAYVDAVLARHSGMSLGLFPDAASAAARVAELPRPLCLHVIERERVSPGEAPESVERELERELERALREAAPAAFRDGTEARSGELVLDVLAARAEPILLGLHRHAAGRSPHPGGRYLYDVPADAPSRAFAKLEEAVQAFELPLRAGDVALELGAAPGGAAYALLRRGIHVIAVDPGALDPAVLAFVGPGGARVSHLQKPMAAVDRDELPAEVQWLLMDVHLAPQVALRAVSRFASSYRRSLLGAVFTLKLNEWAFLDHVEPWKADARAMGLVDPRARQLPAHRREFALAGLTERGRRRGQLRLSRP